MLNNQTIDTSKDGKLILAGSTNTTSTSHTEKTTTAGVWQAQSGHGETSQTYNQTQINGQVTIATGIRTTVLIPEGDLKNQIEALSQQPGQAYIAELAKDPRVNWTQVKLAYDKWEYSQEGLTPAGAAILAIAIAAYTGGMGAELLGGTAATSTSAATLMGSTVYGAAANAGFAALASSAGVSFVNNGGDIGKTLKDMGSSQNVKGIALAMVSAGVLSDLNTTMGLDKVKVTDGFTANLNKAIVNNLANATMTSAITGTPLEDNIKTGLVSAFVSAGAGQTAYEIGNQTANDQMAKALAHAIAGCVAGAAGQGKGGCSAGATGAVVGELAAQWYDPNGTKKPEDTLNFVKVITAAAAAITGDGSAASVSTAVMTGVNAAQNNWLSHAQAQRMSQLKDMQLLGKCDSTCAAEISQLQTLYDNRNKQLAACQGVTTPACQSAVQDVRNAAAEYVRVNAYDKGMIKTYSDEKNETLTLAQQTMSGYTTWNLVKGGANSIVDGVSAMASAGYTGFKAVFGDEAAQAQGKQMLGAGWDFVKDPANWPQLVGAMSPAQREQLAQAYEKGDGKTAATIMGEQYANVLQNLSSGGAAGTIKKVAGVADKATDAATLLKRADVEKVVEVPAGSKGNWDPTINAGTTGNLAPKAAYMLDNGHTYITDDAGRVKAVEGSLSLNKMDRNTYQQLCAGQSGCVGDDGGHLIASSLGGAGDRVNIVPQAATLNRQDWKDMENFFRSELQAGKSVNVKIDVGYPVSGGVRPSEFTVIAFINGKPIPFEFKQ